KRLECSHTPFRCSLQVNFIRRNGRKDFTAFLRSGDQNVQSAFSAFVPQRAKAHCQKTMSVSAITNRDEDNVALIALDIFKILYKKWLGRVCCKKQLRIRVFTAKQFQF